MSIVSWVPLLCAALLLLTAHALMQSRKTFEERKMVIRAVFDHDDYKEHFERNLEQVTYEHHFHKRLFFRDPWQLYSKPIQQRVGVM